MTEKKDTKKTETITVTQQPLTLAQKLHKVWELGVSIPKTGYNSHHGYKYFTEKDVLEVVKRPFADAGLIAMFDVIEAVTTLRNGKHLGNGIFETINACKVTINITIMDVDTEKEILCKAFGYAEDKGDKALYKAITGAVKYFWLKNFGLATEEDPENDDTGNFWGNEAKKQQQAPPPAIPNYHKDNDEQTALKKEIAKLLGVHDIRQPEFTQITGLETLQGNISTVVLAEAYRVLSEHINGMRIAS